MLNLKRLLRKVTDFGGDFVESKSEKRNIIVSNYASVIGCAAMWLLVGALLAVYGFNPTVTVRLLTTSLFFFLPILMNRVGFVVASRLLLCALIPAIVFGVSILDLKAGETMGSSSFVGLRLFLLVGLCFPFLFFELRQKRFLILGLALPVLSIVFFDSIFALFGVGYQPDAKQDLFYEFSNVRALVSGFAIAASLFVLKLMVENAEQVNQSLLIKLEEQNELIKRQAEAEVFELNKELRLNLQRLSEREFILNQSQRVAKVGSWEYATAGSFTFWSEEMYNILGLGTGVDFRSKDLFKSIFGDNSAKIVRDTIRLLRTGEPFDHTVTISTPGGNRKWIRINAFPQFDQGRIVGARGICHDITYFKESEERLRASEYKYRSLFEQASDFIGVFDFNGRFRDVNPSWCKAFGYTKEELMKMRIEDLIEPGQLSERPLKYEELRNGEQVYNQRHVVSRDGTIMDVESNAKKFQDDKILVIGRDVTALRKVQRQIEISEARFRGAFEHSAIGMALVSVDGQWLRVNSELSRIAGYMPEELLEMKIGDIIVQEDRDVEFDLRKLVPYGDHEGAHSERQCIRKDGTRVWVSLNASLIKDHDASPLYFVVQVEDITAEKEAADKLRRYEANIRATINNTDMMIWGVDRNFDTIMFNNQFARHIQARYGQEVYLGANMFPPLGTAEMDIITEKWKALLARALAGERIKIEEQRFGLDYQYALNPIIEGSKVIGVSIFADDVTDRKRRERELNEANKKISELRLLALRSVMSPHFIFNVLNSIQYFIAKNDRFNAINYLSAFSKLVRNILTHSVTNKITLSDEIEMLENYVQLEMTRFENKFAFSLTIDPSIEADSVVIPSLLIQPYVENAILHGLNTKPADGKLWIRVREEEAGMLSFEIEDNGIGRAAAMELRRHNLLPHTSMGINITEERLKLINNGHRTAVEIEDLIENGKPAGTRVKILVSYLPE